MQKPKLKQFFEEVCALEPKYAAQYVDYFIKHLITEEEIPYLSHDLLKEIGIVAVGHRIRILQNAEKLISTPTPTPTPNTHETTKQISPQRYQPVIITEDEDIANDVYFIPNNETTNFLNQESAFNLYSPLPTTTNKSNPNSRQGEHPNSTSLMDTSDIGYNEADNFLVEDRGRIIPDLNKAPSKREQRMERIDRMERIERAERAERAERIDNSFEFEGLVTRSRFNQNAINKHALSKIQITDNDPALERKVRDFVAKSFGNCGIAGRKHQVDCIKELALDIFTKSRTKVSNYLMQHSVGSGKSLTIASLTHFLISATVLLSFLFSPFFSSPSSMHFFIHFTSPHLCLLLLFCWGCFSNLFLFLFPPYFLPLFFVCYFPCFLLFASSLPPSSILSSYLCLSLSCFFIATFLLSPICLLFASLFHLLDRYISILLFFALPSSSLLISLLPLLFLTSLPCFFFTSTFLLYPSYLLPLYLCLPVPDPTTSSPLLLLFTFSFSPFALHPSFFLPISIHPFLV